jgi:uncharacterized protein
MSGPNYFEIEAGDLTRAKAFYESVFGWKFTLDKNLPIEYWRIETGGLRGGLLMRTDSLSQRPMGKNAFTCSMQTDNFDALSEKILSLGGIVALPKFAVLGLCWQGYFQDPEGNTFGLYQPDAEAK